MKVEITSPYGTTYDTPVISPGGTSTTVHFRHGVAVLDDVLDVASDPRVLAFRGMSIRPEAMTYRVRVLDETVTT